MVALGVIGFLAWIACIVLFIISAVRKKTKKWWVLGGCISFIMFIIGMVGASTTPSTSNTSPISNGSSTEIVITYSTTKQTQIGTGFSTDRPQAGNVYLIADMTIENHGESSFDTSRFYFSAIVDNVKYDPAFVFSLDNELRSVSVLNGGTTKGKLAFEVPSQASSIALQWHGLGIYNIRWVKQ